MQDRNWDAMKRALLLLQLLRRQPLSKKELIAAVRAALPGAYTEDNDKARGRTFERDLENVRYRLAATVEWQRQLRQYLLLDPGPYVQSELPDEALSGLAFLKDSFTTSEEIQAVIRPLIGWVEEVVPDDQMRRLTHQQVPIQLNIERVSEGEIHREVWRQITYAIKQRRIITFNYASPIHQKDEPRRHTVEPYEHYFRSGHFYLKAYCLRWVAPNGYEDGSFWANPYRLDYILPDDIELLKTFVHRERQAHMTPIRYKLSPQIVRGGISRYFAEMSVSAPDDEGWVEVTAETDNLFEAYRTLLAYGSQCVALEPPKLVERMEETARFFREQYL